jgi:septal ring factor EnvC (AmiA/AmiB activator)
MRANSFDTHAGASKRRFMLFAALLLAAVCTLAIALEASAPAATPQEKLESTQNKLDQNQASQAALAESIAAQHAAIVDIFGDV